MINYLKDTNPRYVASGLIRNVSNVLIDYSDSLLLIIEMILEIIFCCAIMLNGTKYICESSFRTGFLLRNVDCQSSYDIFDDGSFEILECFFLRVMSQRDKGGAIYSAGSHNITISHCIFAETYSPNGGALYCDNSNIKMKMVCGYKCCANYFLFAEFINGLFHNFSYLSIHRCHYDSYGNECFHLKNPKMYLKNSNFSKNNALCASSISIDNPVYCFGAFCSFTSNNSTREISFCLSFRKGNFTYMNIINNNSPKGNGVFLIQENGHYHFDCCIFDQNKNVLFHIFNSVLVITNSFICHDSKLYTGISPFQTNNSNFLVPTFMFSFLNTYLCEVGAESFINPIATTLIEDPSNHFNNISKTNTALIVFSVLLVINCLIAPLIIAKIRNRNKSDSSSKFQDIFSESGAMSSSATINSPINLQYYLCIYLN